MDLYTFLRSHANLYRRDDPTVAQLVEDPDDSLFATVMANQQYVFRIAISIVIVLGLGAPRTCLSD